MARTETGGARTLVEQQRRWSTADALWWTVAAALFLIPLLMDPLSKDPFRVPKELLFRFFSIVVAALLAVHWTGRKHAGSGGKFASRPLLIVSIAIAGWTLVTVMTSTNLRLSVDSLVTVLCSIAFFFGARVAVKRHPSMRSLVVVLAAAIINALLAMSQAFGWWQPFVFPKEYEGRLSTTALLGNPNDVAMYLLAPSLASIVAANSSKGVRRLAYLMIAAVLLLGLFACGTRSVLMAWTLGVLASAMAWRGRRAVVWIAVGIVLAGALSAPLLRHRLYDPIALGLSYGRYDVLFSERLPAFLAAIEMTRDHPLTGVGPGAYKWNYFQYRIRIAEKYSDRWTIGHPAIFKETHNDHLQILSETGFPGYALFAATIVVLVLRPRKTESATPAAHLVPGKSGITEDEGFTAFAERLKWPLAMALIALMLTQFPLQIAAARVVLLYFFGLCTWRNS